MGEQRRVDGEQLAFPHVERIMVRVHERERVAIAGDFQLVVRAAVSVVDPAAWPGDY